MQVSFLIVTKNRPAALAFTLNKLKAQIDLSVHEVLVFIDGCKATEVLVNQYDWVQWEVAKKSISASPARNALYKKAKGEIFIGLDDDAHPITADFIAKVQVQFDSNKTLGVIAFQEIRGVYDADEMALSHFKDKDSYFTNDFIGCGFAIKKSVYRQTNGFPVWMTIYGEEPALALEVLDLGYTIYYQNDIAVNHRVDAKKRLGQGRNYFRFENQFRNSIRFYLVYYPKPFFKVIKLLVHNFKKYGIKDFQFFRLYNKVFFTSLLQIFSILSYRKPVKKETLQKRNQLKSMNY